MTQLYKHQQTGVEKLIKNPYFALYDEMGCGKSLQVIEATQQMYIRDMIDTVIIVTPAAVRAVWFDPELGELQKHLWKDTAVKVIEFHTRKRTWSRPDYGVDKFLRFMITNYDFIRNESRLNELSVHATPRTLLVLDESSAVKNHRAKQTKACAFLRKKCGRIVLLNGTPIANNPGDMYSQGNLMSPTILDCKNWFHFRSRYAVLGGFQGRQVVQWQHIDDLQRRFAPFVLRRLKVDCLDLPPKLPPVIIDAPLTPTTWATYKDMRDEFITWLDEVMPSMAGQAGVRALRLAQITSGFLGGAKQTQLCPSCSATTQQACTQCLGTGSITDTLPAQEIGREKHKAFMAWLYERLGEDPSFKALVWCRWRAEADRLVTALESESLHVGRIIGGQKTFEREQAMRLLDPTTTPKGPTVVVGIPQAGGMGLNLAASATVVYMSNDYSLKTRLQSEDRVHRPGQVRPVSYFDIVASGPTGQRTIDHLIIKSLRAKEELATWTTSAWRSALTKET